MATENRTVKESNTTEIIEWLHSPEGEYWSVARIRSTRQMAVHLDGHFNSYTAHSAQRAHGDHGSEVFMPGMFSVRAG